ncbi:MAG: T9SS type A sorting domain-containing protein [Rhodothermales bacterium]|nr:T9SS type A sorting domain-containing protein [Rhodothermales bacterium]MBO6779059.1 T9SS type A sorting domain-containing protein [Rhodothermales bacterium]
MRCLRLPTLLALLFTLSHSASGQQLLLDINTRGASSNPRQVTVLGDRIFFVAEDAEGEEGLWFSNGVVGSEQQVPLPEDPRIVAADDTWLYVRADSDEFGSALWITNGDESHLIDERGWIQVAGRTDRGMVFGDSVDDELYTVVGREKIVLLSGTPRSYRNAVASDGELLVTAFSSNLSQVWKTDGTAENTRLVEWGHFANFTGGGIHFAGRDLVVGVRTGIGWQLFEIQPFAEPIAITSVPSPPRDLVISGDLFFFTVRSDDQTWIYASNGTEQGTRRLLGPESPLNPDLWVWAPLNGGVVFSARHPAHGLELFFLDASGGEPTLLTDIHPGDADSAPRRVAADAQRVYFSADDGGGRELWSTDGTAHGTRMVVDLADDPAGSDPDRGTITADAVCLPAETRATGREVWCASHDSGNAWLAADVQPGGTDPSDPVHLYSWGNRVVFQATDGSGGAQVWVTDGTAAGTRRTTDLPDGRWRRCCGGSMPWAESEDHLYFADRAGLFRLSATGNAERFGPGWLHPGDLQVAGDRLYTTIGRESSQAPGLVWLPLSNSGDAIPRRVLSVDGRPVEPGDLHLAGSRVVWFGQDGFGNTALWSADDQTATVLWGVATNGRRITSTVNIDDQLYFTVDAGGAESLWVTDGTQEGSRPVWTGNPHRDVYGLTEFGSQILFFASVGQEQGMPFILDLQTGQATQLASTGSGSKLNDRRFAVAGPRLAYFTTRREVWRTDGTPTGTWEIASSAWGATMLGVAGQKAFLRYDDGQHGEELWAADDLGFRMVADLYPGPGSSNPGPAATLGNALIFSADNPYVGRELFVVQASMVSTGVDEPHPQSVSTQPYPNPATSMVNLPLAAALRTGVVEIQAFDLLGRRVWQSTMQATGGELQLSVEPWPTGLYLIRMQAGEHTQHQTLTVWR